MEMSDREARIADASRRAALFAFAEWLESKADKSRKFPGADLVRAEARADGYDNAASTARLWAEQDQ